MKHDSILYRLLTGLVIFSLIAPSLMSSAALAQHPSPADLRALTAPTEDPDNPTGIKPKKRPQLDLEDDVNDREEWFYSRRTAGNPEITVSQAAAARLQAAQDYINLRNHVNGVQPSSFGGAWVPRGPDP